ncbi:uncharacterized protein LOC131976054 [Centropristis striata]|uniref:uncharacterized protein LOC131976054 n=1 Tax=Centropristis striata TaxID=184440 RepID=UPI0027E01083|nr:uncharacterized protein LOC131976054 [Centropristis striata]
MKAPPVLYWIFLTQDKIDPLKLWVPSEAYVGRVDRLDNDPYTSNLSILLKDVQWADSGKYQCKVSVNTNRDSFRRNGDKTLLMLYDNLTFNLINHSDSLLRCEVNVSQDARFVLSIFHNGYKLQPVDCAPRDTSAALHYGTLSETISLRKEGEYECQLHLNETLVTNSTFHYHLNDAADAEKNVSVTPPITDSEPSLGPFPEPWFLYVALLLVPVSTLLALLTALLIYRC